MRIEIEIDEQRLEELEALEELVRVAGNLNNGTGIVEKIQRLAELEDKLTTSRFRSPVRPSFMLWLRRALHETEPTES